MSPQTTKETTMTKLKHNHPIRRRFTQAAIFRADALNDLKIARMKRDLKSVDAPTPQEINRLLATAALACEQRLKMLRLVEFVERPEEVDA